MPKNRRVVKKDGVIHRYDVPSKMRIGVRSSGKSAFLMSNDALKAVLNDEDSSRYHRKALTVLASRGVTV